VDEELTLDELARRILDWIRANPVMLIVIVVGIVALFSISTVVFTVDRDEQAVVLRFGGYERLAGPGFHWKLPAPVETKYIVQTRKVFSKEFGFRTQQAGVRSRRRRQGYDREALMLTGDLGVARVEWVVQYRKNAPRRFIFNVKNEDRLIRDASEAAMRRIVGDWEATRVITTARQEIARQVQNEMQRIMESYNAGILVDDVLIQSTEPPEPVIPAFKEVDSARQDRERIRNEALQQQERVINEVRGQVSQMLSEAQGDSAALINQAKGDARRFERRGTRAASRPCCVNISGRRASPRTGCFWRPWRTSCGAAIGSTSSTKTSVRCCPTST